MRRLKVLLLESLHVLLVQVTIENSFWLISAFVILFLSSVYDSHNLLLKRFTYKFCFFPTYELSVLFPLFDVVSSGFSKYRRVCFGNSRLSCSYFLWITRRHNVCQAHVWCVLASFQQHIHYRSWRLLCLPCSKARISSFVLYYYAAGFGCRGNEDVVYATL